MKIFLFKSLLIAAISTSLAACYGTPSSSSLNSIPGPFGFDIKSKNNPVNVYDYCTYEKVSNYNIYCISAPDPHPDMSYYRIAYDGYRDGDDICEILGVIDNISRSEGERIIKSKVDQIADQISSHYGGTYWEWDKLTYRRYGHVLSSKEFTGYGREWKRSSRRWKPNYSKDGVPDFSKNGIDYINIRGNLDETKEYGEGIIYLRFNKRPIVSDCYEWTP